MLDLGFCKTSHNLSAIKQLLYLLFHRGGPKGNVQKPASAQPGKTMHCFLFFLSFTFCPLMNNGNKKMSK